MKDIQIKSSSIKREIIICLILFAASNLLNGYAILLHDGTWSELITQLHVVLVVSVVLYLFLAMIRGIMYGIRSLVRKRKTRTETQ